jgi:rhodanese-related sulfurtransferase
VSAFESFITQDGVRIVDVRTAEEYATGHLAGATNIDVQSDFAAGIADLDKDATYALYCRSGVRSGTAKQTMLDAGFTHVVDLSGGRDAWTRAGKPVVTG